MKETVDASGRAGVAALAEGQQIPARRIHIEQADIIRFAGACGDFNPLHFDPELARRAGFAAPIAMGQMTAGILASWIADWCGIEQVLDFQVRFLAPLMAGDDLELSGSVTEIRQEGDDQVCSLALTATVSGRTVVAGSARINQVNERAV